MIDPLADGITFFFDWIKKGLWAQWLRLLFELAYSGLASFLWGFGVSVGALGTTILATVVASKPHIDAPMVFVLSLGSGALWSVQSMTRFLRSDEAKLLRSMKWVLPGDEAAAEINSSFQTITKANDLKGDQS